VSYEPQPPQQQYPQQSQYPAQPMPQPPPHPVAPQPYPPQGGQQGPQGQGAPNVVPFPGQQYLPPDLQGLGPKPTYANEYTNAEEDLDRQADEKVDQFMFWLKHRGIGRLIRFVVLGFVIWGLFNQKLWVGAIQGFIAANPLLGYVFQLVFVLFFVAIQFGMYFFLMGRPQVRWMKPGEGGIGFADYKGNPEVLEGARRIVTLLQGAKEFKEMGGEVVRGLLLEGPPGTGKSYLAQAISTEAKVPFCFCSAPSLIGVFVGMGPLQMMQIYSKARKLALQYGACIIFFDEIDVIAQARNGTAGAGGMGMGMGGMMGGGGGAGGVLNRLLTEMDPMPRDLTLWRKIGRALGIVRGKAEMPPVLTIGATNVVSTLDPALLRPGRFDRKISVDLPDADGRREITEYYLAKVKHDPMPLDRMVQDTIGYSPVAIKYIINEGVIHAHFDGRDSMNYWDFSRARDTHEVGLRQPINNMSYRDKELLAVHEAGHAYAQVRLLPRHRINKVTIVRHGSAGGFSEARPNEEIHMRTREDFLGNIQVSLASGAAQEVLLGVRSVGMVSDLQSATAAAAQMVTVEGMYDTLISTGRVEFTSEKQKEQVERILQAEYKKVKALITEHRDVVRALSDELIARNDLIDIDVLEIISHFEPLPEHYGADGEMPMRYVQPNAAPPISADGD